MSTQTENANTVEQYEKNEKGERKLMNKTKKELVGIIFRKDDIEKNLRKEKADIELDFNKAKEMISKKDNIINNLNQDIKIKDNVIFEKQKYSTSLQSFIDDFTNKNTKLVSRNKKLFTYIFIEGVVIVGLVILCFCF